MVVRFHLQETFTIKENGKYYLKPQKGLKRKVSPVTLIICSSVQGCFQVKRSWSVA